MIYISIVILLVCFIYHYDYQEHVKWRKNWYLLFWVIFVLIGGLRYRLGVDTVAYEAGYNNLPTLSEFFLYNFEDERYGLAYMLLAAIARSISNKFVILQLIQSIFVNSILFSFFYKYTKNCFFAILLYFIVSYSSYTCEVMRESCAIGVFLIGWKYFITNKWFKYYIFATIAVLFHPSALIIWLFPICYFRPLRVFFKFGKIYLISTSIVILILSILYTNFFELIKLIEFADMQNYASTYENSKYAESASLNIYGAIFYFVKYILYIVLSIYLLKNTHFIQQNSMVPIEKIEYMSCWFIYIAIATLFINIFYRFSNYTYPFAILLVSNIIFGVFKAKKTFIKLSFACWMVIVSPFLVTYAYRYFAEDGESGIKLIRRYYPYASVINPVKDTTREKLFDYYSR